MKKRLLRTEFWKQLKDFEGTQMDESPWNDDDTWWQQLDAEMQEREEEERIEACNNAIAIYMAEQENTHAV